MALRRSLSRLSRSNFSNGIELVSSVECYWLKLNYLTHRRQFRWQAMALLNESGERGALVVFAVGQYHTRLAWRDDIKPTHEIALPGVRAEPAQRVNRRFHCDFLSENLHLFLAIDKQSSE